MRQFARTLAAIAAATSTAAPLGAQTQPSPPASPTVWQVDWTENACQIATGSKGGVGVALRITPGMDGAGLYLVGPESLPFAKEPGEAASVTFKPGGATFPGLVTQREAPGRRVLQIAMLPPAFVDSFGKSESLTVAGRGGQVTASIKGANEAMAAMRQCINEGLQEWGIDPKGYAALRQPPVAVRAEGVLRADDYPAEALARNESGNVVARLSIDATGRVTACTPVVTSNSKSLDATSCRIWSKRVRYQPAIGADGRPTSSFAIMKMEWCMDVKSCERLMKLPLK